MDIDIRGFSYRPVYPQWFQPDFRERLLTLVNSPEFAAVFAALLHHSIGYLNFTFFVIAIVTICIQAFFSLVRRDGIYDPEKEKQFILDIRPRLLYIVTGGLLRIWRRVWWIVTMPFWVRPEDFVPGKVLTIVVLGVLGILWFDWRGDWRYVVLAQTVSSYVAASISSIAVFISDAFSVVFRKVPRPAKKQVKYYEHKDDGALQTGEIRLLELKRWLPFLGVRAILYPVNLQEKPVYEAISYTWGTSKDLRKITINGKPFTTSTSTHDALYGRSSFFRSRVLWIDFVCIDQTSLSERGSQVKMMTKIYESATRVVVWLGNPFSPRLAIGLLNEMATLPPTVDLYRRYERLTSSFQWLSMVDFFNLLWFTRVWIVQEVAVAKEVIFICGGMTFSWEMLVKWANFFRDPQISALMGLTALSQKARANIVNFSSIARVQQRYRMTAPFRRNLESFRRADAVMNALHRINPQLYSPAPVDSIGGFLKPLSLPFLLTDFCSFSSTDPRDKIFAFTGLATDEPNLAFTPDYTKPVGDVYRETAIYLYKSEKPFCVVSCAGLGDDKRLNVPSWVPDWTNLPKGAPFTHPSYFDDVSPVSRCSACGDTKANLFFDEAIPNFMGLHGILVDEVASLGNPFDVSAGDMPDMFTDEIGNRFSPTEFIENYTWYCEARALAKRATKYGDSDEEIEDAFWRTLVGDQTPFKRPAPDILYKDFKQWVQLSEYNDRIGREVLANTRRSLPTDDAYWQTVQDTATWGLALGSCASMRRFAVTKDGFMAIVPAMAKVDDVVSIASGARYPLLLRKKGEMQIPNKGILSCYELVGECYVHGIMDGEMMNTETKVRELLIV
ncbi:hypothetical protein VTL71DRAFT_7472 [Oculimacula yallundae]|uniref:Heterokaryon incompatibility domain-containing protein n=1 Tax=Oculimacula yallundae TaxID=86028 RepID=A0ABR4BU83_9HELO